VTEQPDVDVKAFIEKLRKDNIGFLGSALAWSVLISLIPIVVGLIAIASLFLQSPSAQSTMTTHLSAALQGAFTKAEIHDMVRTTVQHTGLLSIIGLLGVLWGGSKLGGAISTVFQPIFHVKGRSFLVEKLIDIGMIIVFTTLMVVIIGATAAGALLNRLISSFQVPGIVEFLVGTIIALAAAFLLFAVIYVAFPNAEPRFRLGTIWPGAAIAAVLFELLTYIWPLYAHFSHFSRYGAVIFPLLVLTAWIYFFCMILLVGAEFVAIRALRDARAEGRRIGPSPDGTVPQHAADSQRQGQPVKVS
jgi:membrane protein